MKIVTGVLAFLLLAGIIAGFVVRNDYEEQIRAEEARADSLRDSISVVKGRLNAAKEAREAAEARADSTERAANRRIARLSAESDSIGALVLEMVPDSVIGPVKALIAVKDSIISEKDSIIAAKDAVISHLKGEIAQYAVLTARKDSLIDWQEGRIEHWRSEAKKEAMKGQFRLVSGRTLIDIALALGGYGIGRATS